ncbi:hypothetical protein T484DRAFT_1974456 [Baffinella frigidus]|nr:hypothetical protein T484DRAFT_1974456 [Cryptophyta sp. CCMP2293]|mmetsp:Transcript_20206/g.48845  ORF Transcript_20206/g.48845 Transcript_20206/m.48845 type:complete len:252 (-) Transcript_20206:43-798(-)
MFRCCLLPLVALVAILPSTVAFSPCSPFASSLRGPSRFSGNGAVCSAPSGRSAGFGVLSLRAETPSEVGGKALSNKPLGKATLQADTSWRISLALSGALGEGGAPVDLSCKAVFVEEEGYEPPQGIIKFEGSNILGGQRPSWNLSEDPAAEGFDKAGFWIWGLFEEPKYPFMLLEFEVLKEIPLSSGVIPVGRMYGQCKVTRDKEKGVSISDGTLSVKETERIDADLVGLSQAILYADRPVGTFTLRQVAD